MIYAKAAHDWIKLHPLGAVAVAFIVGAILL